MLAATVTTAEDLESSLSPFCLASSIFHPSLVPPSSQRLQESSFNSSPPVSCPGSECHHLPHRLPKELSPPLFQSLCTQGHAFVLRLFFFLFLAPLAEAPLAKLFSLILKVVCIPAWVCLPF